MLKITIPSSELYDPKTDSFIYIDETTLSLEHSLVSLSKWEMKWKKPFINQQHTLEEFDDYIRCMTITQNVKPELYLGITNSIRIQVREYMEDPMTAAVIKENPNDIPRQTKFITSDLIYYWMVALQIPFECQKWHLNRLLTLIKIANIEQKPPKKSNPADIARKHHSINAARRAAAGKF